MLWKKKHLFSKYLDFFGFFNYDSNSFFRRLFKRSGAHRSFHSGSLRAAAALSQSGAGVFKQFNKWDIDSIVERKYYNHHLTHIINAISGSDLVDGIGLVIDGGGEATAVSIYKIQNREVVLVKAINTPFSLGALYSICTNAFGFSTYKGEEWKVMGLPLMAKEMNCLKTILKIFLG